MAAIDDLYDTLRAEHRVHIAQTASGYRWECSCGREGRTSVRTAGLAASGRDRHLRVALRAISKAAAAAVPPR